MSDEFQISHILNKECLACESTELRTILDLKDQPLANNYHLNMINDDSQTKYPLKLNICEKCFHLQLSHTVNPDLMFKHYLYVSGTTNTLKEYFINFAKKTLEYFPEAKNVLDIASNDGSQLDAYLDLDLNTYGIDPAANLFELAKSKGHTILCDYFNSNTANKLINNYDIITAQNVFAHNRHTQDFLNACKQIMHDKSVLFIQTSQANMVINNEFDTIYHEHISFFNTFSMKTLVEKCGLVLNDIFKTDIHGTSYVFVITKNGHLPNSSVNDMLKFEKESGLYNILKYPKYALQCYKIAFELKNIINSFKSKGYHIIGYGAAAKGMTLLNFATITLDYIIDDNPLKQNLFTPGMNIPIFSSDKLLELETSDKVLFIPLAWNFFEEIKTRIKAKRNINTDIFVKYFPNISLD
jgi:2-polyprenyl-3-methyl-5-hydroxy-6-metoxy-1,4-benzoquinol methylase